MTQLPGHKLWIFSGAESTQSEFRGLPVSPDGWYVGNAEGSEIASGPHRDSQSGLFVAEIMTDTSGT